MPGELKDLSPRPRIKTVDAFDGADFRTFLSFMTLPSLYENAGSQTIAGNKRRRDVRIAPTFFKTLGEIPHKSKFSGADLKDTRVPISRMVL